MNAVRFLSRVSQPLLYSFSPRVVSVLWAPCRTIATDKDQIKFGNVDGKIKSPDSTSSLDMYVGKWIHDPKLVHQLEKPMQDYDKRQHQVLSELGVKNYIEYMRNNGTWKVEHGFVGEGKTLSYEFVLGEMFIMLNPDNNFVKTLVYQEGECMVWTFYPVEAPEDVLRVTSEIRENKLIWKTEYADGIHTTRVYLKE